MKTMFSRLLGTRSRSRRAAARPIRRHNPLRLEALDDRVMPSVTVGVDGTQLQLSGDSGNDNISVTASTVTTFSLGTGFHTKTTVKVNADFADGSTTKSWDGITDLVMWSGGGNDTFTNNSGLADRFVGTGG